MINLTQSQEWLALQDHYKTHLENTDIEQLFNVKNYQNNELNIKYEGDIDKDISSHTSNRFETLSFCFDQLSIDFSKQKLTQETILLLEALANNRNLKNAIRSLIEGQKVNTTENRAALHSALRLREEDSLVVDGIDINFLVQNELKVMADIVSKIRSGHWRGFSGKPITDVVNLGVGGSDLGPLLVCHALDEFKFETEKRFTSNPINVHFASTMDGSQVSQIFENLNPETTVFIMVSKSFSTIDTLSNAASAKSWLLSHCDNEALIIKQHFIGISTSEQKMSDWGIHKDHQLKLWDWVGGRFSLWSTVGLSIALKIGMDNFRQFLDGANALDNHFYSTELNKNLPVLLGLVGIWNCNFLKMDTQAILPYDARLKYFPDYLTQLEMESNGKSVTLEGDRVNYDTCPVLLGDVGPNAQHAFYQLLHQGTRKVSCDFIAPIKRFSSQENNHQKSLYEQHLLTLANCFAQSRALMLGGSSANNTENSNETLSNHKIYPGNQPSTTILLKELSPYSLGQLIALYEHKVFVMATIWGINPFDQWGVELGKIMANETLEELKSDEPTLRFDQSTNGLLDLIKNS